MLYLEEEEEEEEEEDAKKGCFVRVFLSSRVQVVGVVERQHRAKVESD